ncbi:MAG: hypothetical protein WC728_09245 [Elusimicrobiota bacterium]
MRSGLNRIRTQTPWEWARNGAFILVGLWMLSGLHYGFWRLLSYLDGVELIGGLLIWKLTAMTLLTTFSMVALSSLIIALTTLFYSSDLKFLLRSPVGIRTAFADKALEAVFFSSWMIVLVVLPYMTALAQVKGWGPGFHAVFLLLMVPFMVLACSLGIAFTLVLLYLFPSSRTRDVLWILSSLSVALLYMLLRFSEPERLIRPDALRLVAEYLEYLQAPTAPYAPSWWLTQAVSSYAHGRWALFWREAGLLCLCALGSCAALLALAGVTYAKGYSGAQESRRQRRPIDIPPGLEHRLAAGSPVLASLYWKERKTFFRDVKHWSQIVLVAALCGVYLFSIHRLPLDTPDLKSLVCFINIGIAGFVLSSLGLRFTFPSISLEGRSFWVVRSAPLGLETLMLEKFLFSLVPMLLLATLLIAASNHLLRADRFISWLSIGTIWLLTWTLCGMGVGFGAVFPRFKVENIHQVESSAGGFAYMACALALVAVTVAAEAWPVKMHFQARFGRADAWDWDWVAACAASLVLVNAAGFILPWMLGRRCLQRYEGE